MTKKTFTLKIVGLSKEQCEGVTEHLGRNTPQMQDDMETYFSDIENSQICKDCGKAMHRRKCPQRRNITISGLLQIENKDKILSTEKIYTINNGGVWRFDHRIKDRRSKG